MDQLEERVADLEQRLAALEVAEPPERRSAEGDFWALDGLKEQLAGLQAADGGVTFAGAVRLPTGERYEWQQGALTEGLLGEDWTGAAEVISALGNPVRLRLLQEIMGGRRTVAELAELDDMGTTGQIYHHLRHLTGAGWLHTTGRGLHAVPAARVVPLLVVLSVAQS
ncbi:ArsR family transcriptional regulator [Streptomyces oceani]|uniref:ArsR family transcriptional regulator n=1 Tax=Streptomyces oceani TaxID=1075402 RepID=A0A1E7KLH2_9ACTN|nr:ArsR family transcriptional regulator [Streptomyces oceani]